MVRNRESRERRRRGQRGQGLTEFAIFAPMAVFLMIGMVEIGRVHVWHVNLAASAFAGALYAAQSPANAADTDGIRDHVMAELTELPNSGPTSITPNITVTTGPVSGDGFGKQEVTVSVNLVVPALFSMPYLPRTYVIAEDASARVLQVETRS